MRRRISIILIIAGLFISALSALKAGAAQEADFIRLRNLPVIDPAVHKVPGKSLKVWVAFTDKGVFTRDDFASAAAEVELTERAVRRRAKVGMGIEFSDLPIYEPYLSEIEALAISRGVVSRWLNAVSITVDRENLAELGKKDFVAEVRPVARVNRTEYFRSEEDVSWKGVEGFNERFASRGHEGAFYGNSYDQLDQIQVIEAHRRGLYGEGVLIGVIDGGFMFDHRAMMHVDLIDEWDFIFNDGDTNYDPLQDIKAQPRHGTGCMSTIAAYDPGNLIGCAPFASFVVAKSEDVRSETEIEEDYWVAAVEWVEMMGADIVSSSLGYKDWYNSAEFDGLTSYCSRGASRAYEMGMVVCTSNGNEGPMPITLGAPGDAEGVLAIGAVDSTGALTRFSSRGPSADGRIKPNICAMGRHVTAVRPYTYDEYGLWNGTSLSCPLAAGGLALVIQAHPDWTPWQVMEAAENTATHAVHPDNDWGYGILQVAKALDYPSISGYIRDEASGKPIRGAEVHFTSPDADTSGVIMTDASGFYLLVNMPEGRYELTAKAEGYEDSAPGKVKVPPDDVMDFGVKRE